MVSCQFCGTEITPGTGKIFVQKDGKMSHYCSHKCEKNHRTFKRKPRHVRWTKEFHQVKKGVKG